MDYIERLIEKYPQLAECTPSIQAGYLMLDECYADGKKRLLCGNNNY